MKILLELRPALDGHAGIPQEARLLFRGLALLEDVGVEGLIQSSTRVLAKGLPAPHEEPSRRLSTDKQINRLSRVVVSLQASPGSKLPERLVAMFQLAVAAPKLMLWNLLRLDQKLFRFDPLHFRDFVWRSLFSKTLPLEDFDAVTSSQFRVARVPWSTMHACALATRKLGHALYPRLDTRGFDIMIAETPYPGSVAKGTTMVVRYHDAIPLLMPHTISNKAYHQASHYQALRKNVADGAYFACVSDATRRDLVAIFPQAAARAITIHNMVSHHYFPEESSARRVPEIVKTRLNRSKKMQRVALFNPALIEEAAREQRPVDYLLMVSTIEPRKNHSTLLAAWEQLRTERFPGLKLLIVGALGWDHKAIVQRFKPWLEHGDLCVLEDVPSAELRLLYKHARATVCPSFGEGFDFSGVEAMRCGGAVAASDIPVHRDVYGDAAEYFSPYSARGMAQALARVIDPAQAPRRQQLVDEGAVISARYLPERILPQWQDFLASLQR